ncbi:HAD-IIA family hydrolase [Roseovarius sp. MMSF_3281]|uniref:HAD-IIA family hydrolase n=1 Tax=Roseovarius sp. MMSF_3281 TaxID=3046694 RepID=UPI00273F6A5D|nr:HAD family hydrolase [Roseovarius sp. MMSF_3281]
MRLDDYDAILCDLDGCLISGATVLPGAKDVLVAAGERLVILSNNSTDTPETLSKRLQAMELHVPPERIVLAGTAALDHLVGFPDARICLYGSQVLREYAKELGLSLTREASTHVVLTRDENYGYAQLRETLALIAMGAQLVVANPDISHPGPDGTLVPETGSLLSAILSVYPGFPHVIIGKPEPNLYHDALRRFKKDVRTVLAIGDNPSTDAKGAARLGYDFVLISPHIGVGIGLQRLLSHRAN